MNRLCKFDRSLVSCIENITKTGFGPGLFIRLELKTISLAFAD